MTEQLPKRGDRLRIDGVSRRALHRLIEMTSWPRLERCMQRDRLLLAEAIDAAERIIELTAERSPADFDTDRDRRDAFLLNFTVLGKAVAELSEAVTTAHPDVEWSDPVRATNRVVLVPSLCRQRGENGADHAR